MPVKQKHRYTTCHDADCQRTACIAYKIGYQTGYQEGREEAEAKETK